MFASWMHWTNNCSKFPSPTQPLKVCLIVMRAEVRLPFKASAPNWKDWPCWRRWHKPTIPALSRGYALTWLPCSLQDKLLWKSYYTSEADISQIKTNFVRWRNYLILLSWIVTCFTVGKTKSTQLACHLIQLNMDQKQMIRNSINVSTVCGRESRSFKQVELISDCESTAQWPSTVLLPGCSDEITQEMGGVTHEQQVATSFFSSSINGISRTQWKQCLVKNENAFCAVISFFRLVLF